MTVKQNLQMKVRSRGRSRAADLRDHVSGADVCSYSNQQLRTMPVSRHQGFAGRGITLDNDAQAVAAGIAGHGDNAVVTRADNRTLRHTDVNAGMVILNAADRVNSVAVIARHI